MQVRFSGILISQKYASTRCRNMFVTAESFAYFTTMHSTALLPVMFNTLQNPIPTKVPFEVPLPLLVSSSPQEQIALLNTFHFGAKQQSMDMIHKERSIAKII